MLVVSCLELALRSGIFAVLSPHKMDESLIGWELTSALWSKAGRLLLLLRAPDPLSTLSYFLMHT